MTESCSHAPWASTPAPAEQLPTSSEAARAGELVCALAGCETVIEPAARGHARRYCCTAHRKIARRQRRESANAATPAGQPSPDERHTAAGQAGAEVAAVAGRTVPEAVATGAFVATQASLATSVTHVGAAAATDPRPVAAATDGRAAAPTEVVEAEPRTEPIPVLR